MPFRNEKPGKSHKVERYGVELSENMTLNLAVVFDVRGQAKDNDELEFGQDVLWVFMSLRGKYGEMCERMVRRRVWVRLMWWRVRKRLRLVK